MSHACNIRRRPLSVVRQESLEICHRLNAETPTREGWTAFRVEEPQDKATRIVSRLVGTEYGVLWLAGGFYPGQGNKGLPGGRCLSATKARERCERHREGQE